MHQLFEIQDIIIKQTLKSFHYVRNVIQNIDERVRVLGVVGTRGLGKTTYLVRNVIEAGAANGKALYVSADNLYFLDNKLIDLVDQLYKETSVRLLCIDEIHKYPNWNQELKNIIDIYQDFKIRFTGSSAIDIIYSKYDLSRRVSLVHLPGLSFREYLEFKFDYRAPIFNLNDVLTRHEECTQQLDSTSMLQHFYTYNQTGYYPSVSYTHLTLPTTPYV